MKRATEMLFYTVEQNGTPKFKAFFFFSRRGKHSICLTSNKSVKFDMLVLSIPVPVHTLSFQINT